jgi:calcineurin-like phosphoesterase family protein
VLTAILSDLHLGAGSERDVLRLAEARERLAAGLAEADRVVLLGDALELREAPVGQVVEAAAPAVDMLAAATAGRELVVVPGNHDHQLAAPWLERLRLEGRDTELGVEQVVEPEDAGVLGWLIRRLPETRLRLAYPGIWLRPDVYATHGHYLDVHLTIPRIESLAAGLVSRLVRGRNGRYSSPADYEAVLGPLYGLLYAVAQADTPRMRRGSGVSREVWRRLNHEGKPLGRLLIGRLAIPGVVAGLNRAGFGPYGSDLSGAELRRSGLRALAEVVTGLGVEAEHVVFGHTHRRGPVAGDDPAEWRVPGGPRLWNSGTWYHEPVLLDSDRDRSPYWPGGCIMLRDDGPPEPVNLLEGLLLESEMPPDQQ